MKLGERLKQLRTERNMTQDQLAETLYVSRQTVSKWELGVNEPDIETLQKLAEIFEISVGELFESQTVKHALPLHKKLFIANILIGVFYCLSLFVLWRFLPEMIPAHYNSKGEIDRYGNRAEVLLCLTVFVVLFVLEIIIYFKYYKEDTKSTNITSITCIVSYGVLWIFVFILYGLNIKENVLSLIMCLTALVMLTVSVAMHPIICKQYSIMGVRTKLTMNSGEAWNKVNKFACYVLCVASIACLALNMIFTHYLVTILSALVYLPASAAIYVYNAILAKKIAH